MGLYYRYKIVTDIKENDKAISRIYNNNFYQNTDQIVIFVYDLIRSIYTNKEPNLNRCSEKIAFP